MPSNFSGCATFFVLAKFVIHHYTGGKYILETANGRQITAHISNNKR